MSPSFAPVACIDGVTLRYGKTTALDNLSLAIPASRRVGLIGPDGVGKSSLLALIAGARQLQKGRLQVLDGDMASRSHRTAVCPRIAYMPQGLGKNLYATLTVRENLDFFGSLFGQPEEERRWRIDELVKSTGLAPFTERPAGELSGGMKQKLGLCCALIHDPDLLILDEPTTGVDPLARSQFWELIGRIRGNRPSMSVLVATAYMDEARDFDWLVAMDEGRILAAGTPAELLQRTGCADLESAFIALLPEGRRRNHQALVIPPRRHCEGVPDIAIEAHHLTLRFGDFVAVRDVSFRIERGEIFGFLGSNGCGKSTTMKMLTGLLPASEGEAFLFGQPVDATNIETRKRVGYMSQTFSLYGELTVRQNLELHARLFHLSAPRRGARVRQMLGECGLAEVADSLSADLPLGVRQRLSLAVALIHEPEILILDEPTSGVDPVARDAFWEILVRLSREDGVTIFISTHFMNEALRCDRMSMMHAGTVLGSDTPRALMAARGLATLEQTFIAYLREAITDDEAAATRMPAPARMPAAPRPVGFSLQRLLTYSRREGLELRRDPIRATLVLLGTLLLMLIIGYGINMDVENLSYAILDHDQTTTSQSYALNISGSRYFIEKAPLASHADLDQRMREGDISLAIEIPPHFGRDLKRGDTPEVAFWVDGAMPMRADTVKGYVQGLHLSYLQRLAQDVGMSAESASQASVVVRFRYNPDVQSLPAMVPAVIPLLLMMIPAMLTALGVVREKELGSIINFYVTPTSRLEFLLGKQLPYIVLGMVNFLCMLALAVFIFEVPIKGSLTTLCMGALLYVICATSLGLLMSCVLNSQIAAIFATAIATLVPAIQFSGLMHPVSAMEGVGALIGNLYPTSHFLTISRGVFSKALGLADLYPYFIPLLLTIPVLILIAVAGLRKQEK